MGDLLVQILLAIGGGIGSVYLDDRFQDPNGMLRPRAVTDTITIGPGAQASLGLALALAFVPSSILPRGTLRIGLGAMASGGIVTQGTSVLGKHVLPILKGEKAASGQLPANTAATGWPMHAYPYGNAWGVGHQPTSYEVARGVSGLRTFS